MNTRNDQPLSDLLLPPLTLLARPWVVLKFGGTSVASAPRWRSIAALAEDRLRAGLRPLVVVSALAGVTDGLLSIVKAGAESELALAMAKSIRDRHLVLSAELDMDLPETTARWLDRLDALIRDPRARAATLPWQAELLAIGELASSAFGAAFLQHIGLAAAWLDSRDWLCAAPSPNASDWACWLSVNCASPATPTRAAQLAASAAVFVAPGFIARNAGGDTVVLGRGGSDTSAALLGAMLGAERVEIWTDVAGMFSADPRLVPDARLLARLDFEEATEIATTGAKVLHPRSLAPLRDAGVPLWIKDTRRPELAGTVIDNTLMTSPTCAPDVAASVKAISQRRGIMLVAMESIGMWQQIGFLADVFAEFKHHGLSVDLISSAETNVTVSLDPTENLVTTNVLEALCTDLAKVCRVKVIGPCAAITLVGRGMRGLLPKLSGVWAEFGSMPVHLVSQSSNNLNLTFVVDEALAEGLVARVHESLIGTRALCAEDANVFGPSWRELYQARPETTAPSWWRQRRDDLLALAMERTPRYIYDRATLRARAQSLLKITAVDRWFYASKANAHPAILRELAELGFGLECVSIGELHHAEAVAATAPKLYTSNFAPLEELAAVVATTVALTIDNAELLTRHGALFAGREILLRVDLGIGRGHHDKVRTGGAASKFGIALADLPTALRAAEAVAASVIGLHAHLGSGILSVNHFAEVYAQLAVLAETIPSVAILNIGGGIGVPSRPGEMVLDLAALGQALSEVKAAYPNYQLWMEPGRFLVAEAGVLLARVTQTKRKQAVDYVGIDAGMNNLLRPALYDAYHPIHNLSRLDAPATTRVQVVGPICESGDVLGSDRQLPDCQPGDVILIADAGAYGAVMASHYNRRAGADEVML